MLRLPLEAQGVAARAQPEQRVKLPGAEAPRRPRAADNFAIVLPDAAGDVVGDANVGFVGRGGGAQEIDKVGGCAEHLAREGAWFFIAVGVGCTLHCAFVLALV